LGAIPIIGNLFKSRSGSRQKKNLLVFIRPRILRDDVQTESLSEGKYNGIRREEQTLHKGHITLLPGQTQPSIPPPPVPPQSRPTGPSTPTNPVGAAPVFVPEDSTVPASTPSPTETQPGTPPTQPSQPENRP
jgi:general secretion pathway protein D